MLVSCTNVELVFFIHVFTRVEASFLLMKRKKKSYLVSRESRDYN